MVKSQLRFCLYLWEIVLKQNCFSLSILVFEFDEEYKHYWSYIPHFIHVPFYVYAYAFGDCLVNSLYAIYQAQPEGFADKYFALLSAGGSQRYDELLAPFGLDARDPTFWDKGLAMIEGMIDQLEAMDG